MLLTKDLVLVGDPGSPDGTAERVAARVVQRGWCVCDGSLESCDVASLAAECRRLWEEGRMRRAGVGTGSDWTLREDVRQDRVKWLEEGETSPAEHRYRRLLEALRLAFNRSSYLGLFEFEGHYAVYPPRCLLPAPSGPVPGRRAPAGVGDSVPQRGLVDG